MRFYCTLYTTLQAISLLLKYTHSYTTISTFITVCDILNWSQQTSNRLLRIQVDKWYLINWNTIIIQLHYATVDCSVKQTNTTLVTTTTVIYIITYVATLHCVYCTGDCRLLYEIYKGYHSHSFCITIYCCQK